MLERLREAKAELMEVLGNEAQKAKDLRPPVCHQAATRTSVYRYRLTDKLDTWLILIAPGCDLTEARKVLENQFGKERVIEVMENG